MEDLDHLYDGLQTAVLNNRNNAYCLGLWSRFIRVRDGNRCIICNSKKRLSAHHVIRKSFWKHLRFQTGNGITLCHKDPHTGFNGRPDLNQPMDAQGGEKIDQGRRIEQAYQIWNQTPRGMLEAMMNALGVKLAENYVQNQEVSIHFSDKYTKEDGSPADIMYFRYIPPTEFKENPDDSDE